MLLDFYGFGVDFQEDDNSVRGGYDSYSEGTVINKSIPCVFWYPM